MRLPNQVTPSSIAPVGAALLLVAVIAFGGIDSRPAAGAAEYNAAVRTSIEQIPYRVGAWVGVDSEPTQAAVRLLTPNKILQRRYINSTTGASVSLLIVHCGDVRDMLGHYPPVCYPAHGWRAVATEPTVISVNGAPASTRLYQFSRREDMVEHRMSVLDFFVLPGQQRVIFADMDEVERAARSGASGGLGVAQIQLVFAGDASVEDRRVVTGEILLAIENAVHAIGRGVQK